MTSTPAPQPPPSHAADFPRLQARLAPLLDRIVPDRTAPRTVVVVPSLSIDQDVAGSISGLHHYEERMLSMLMLLRQPRTRVIYLSSQPIADTTIDYYLHLLQGVPREHARGRLVMLACHDGSTRPLSDKVLQRPRLLARLQAAIGDPALAYMTAYTVSVSERALAVRLGIPIYGCDPALQSLGSKSGGRGLMRQAGLAIPDGAEDLQDEAAIVAALTAMKAGDPGLQKAVIKLNEGLSGEGNAVFHFKGAPSPEGSSSDRSANGDTSTSAPGTEALAGWIRDNIRNVSPQAKGMGWDDFLRKVQAMGAIVEAFIEGEEKRSPSAQFRIDPFGAVIAISTHDQVLDGQVFLGCRFPADEAYRVEIQDAGLKVAALLQERGVLGRFAVDFISVRRGTTWQHYGIELNLRKGGTTHPFMMLEFLTGGAYDCVSGLFRIPTGEARFYYASDNLESPHYKGLTPADLIDIAVLHGLHYDGTTQEGVVFHLIGALSEFGKVGIVCVGASAERAEALYHRTVEILDREQAAGQ